MVAIMLGADNGFFYASQVMHFSSPFTVFLIYHKQISNIVSKAQVFFHSFTPVCFLYVQFFLSLFLSQLIQSEEQETNRHKCRGKNTDPHQDTGNALRIQIDKEIRIEESNFKMIA